MNNELININFGSNKTKYMTKEQIIQDLEKLNEGQYLFFNPKEIRNYQAARNHFFKSEKIFEICADKIIRLENLKPDNNGTN